MLEKFKQWIELKFQIHSKITRPNFREGEVWWSNFGQNVGDEQNGTGDYFMRPVIILKKFNRHLALIIPTSRQLKNNPFYIKIKYKNQNYSALISHIHTIDAKRLQRKIVQIDDDYLLKIKEKVKKIL